MMTEQKFSITVLQNEIYIQNIIGNYNIESYAYLVHLKQQLNIEKQIFLNEGKQGQFDKYLFIDDEL